MPRLRRKPGRSVRRARIRWPAGPSSKGPWLSPRLGWLFTWCCRAWRRCWLPGPACQRWSRPGRLPRWPRS